MRKEVQVPREHMDDVHGWTSVAKGHGCPERLCGAASLSANLMFIDTYLQHRDNPASL